VEHALACSKNKHEQAKACSTNKWIEFHLPPSTQFQSMWNAILHARPVAIPIFAAEGKLRNVSEAELPDLHRAAALRFENDRLAIARKPGMAVITPCVGDVMRVRAIDVRQEDLVFLARQVGLPGHQLAIWRNRGLAIQMLVVDEKQHFGAFAMPPHAFSSSHAEQSGVTQKNKSAESSKG
jgi:hypothetical protein